MAEYCLNCTNRILLEEELRKNEDVEFVFAHCDGCGKDLPCVKKIIRKRLHIILKAQMCNEQTKGCRKTNIYALHFVGTVLFWHKSIAFYAKRLKKVCQEPSLNGLPCIFIRFATAPFIFRFNC